MSRRPEKSAACEPLERRWMLAVDPTPQPMSESGADASGGWRLEVGLVDLVRGQLVRVESPGVLRLAPQAGSRPLGDLRIALHDDRGHLIVATADSAGGDPRELRQFVRPGDYVFAAEADVPGNGEFRIDFTPGDSPVLPVKVGGLPASVATADIDGDGILDMLVANYGSMDRDSPDKGDLAVRFGIGDGAFRPAESIRVGDNPVSVAVGAAGPPGAGLLAVTANRRGDSVSVIRITPEGVFAAPLTIPVGRLPAAVAVADIDRDGRADIVVANSEADDEGPLADGIGSCSVILQTSAGGFIEAARLPMGGNPEAVAVGDLDDDGLPDIVAALPYSDTVLVMRQSPDGSFGAPSPPIRVGWKPNAVAIGDVDGDHLPDIVVANSMSDDVTLVRQGVDGVFVASASTLPVGTSPYVVILADIDGDGCPDILTANQGSNDVSVLRGLGAGAFRPASTAATGSYPSGLAVGHFDADRTLDLVTADLNDGTVSLLRGFGDGGFLERARLSAGSFPYAVAVGDVNGDGRADLVTANRESSDLAVMLGRADGSFGRRRTVPLAAAALRPVEVCLVDLNGDGRLDIVTANEGRGLGTREPEAVEPGGVCILYGLGDGTFTAPQVLLGEHHPLAVAVADVNGDALPDIVAAVGRPPDWLGGDVPAGAVHVLIQGRGGTFSERQPGLGVGRLPVDVAIADLDGDQAVDIVCCTQGMAELDDAGGVAVMAGDGRGGFAEPIGIAAGGHPQSLTVGDVDGDGRTDVAIVNVNRPDRGEVGDVSVLLQRARGQFAAQPFRPPVGVLPYGAVMADVTGDGRPDIVVANVAGKSISMLANVGDGEFAAAVSISLGTAAPCGLAIADVDRDGRPDIVTANLVTNDVTVVMQSGWTTLGNEPNPYQGGVSQSVGILGPDAGRPGGTITVDRSGNVVVRRGGLGGIVAVSPSDAFDLCRVASGDGTVRFAAVDAGRGTVSIHREAANGRLAVGQRLAAPASDEANPTASVLMRIVSSDLDGNGWGDLVVSNPGAGTLDVLLARADGSFDDSAWQRLIAGAGPARILITDVSGDDVPDLVAANQASGDVSVWLGVAGVYGTAAFTGATGFAAENRYRTSGLPHGYATDPVSGKGTAPALFNLSDIAVGDVDGDGYRDIVAVNSQARSFAVLAGVGGGRFSAAREFLVRVPDTRGPLVSGSSIAVHDVAVGLFDGDAKADIALLDRDGERLLLYSGESLAGLSGPAAIIPLSGNLPRSISVVDLTGPTGAPDGVRDIVVGNEYGDVLLLGGIADAAGLGTGRFTPSVRADTAVALVATDVDGDGLDDFVYGDKGLDHVRLDRSATSRSFTADQSQGLIGPSAVAVVTESFGGRPYRNLVVANGGGNEILIFRRDVAASASAEEIFLPPQRFFVGTNPTAVSVADVDQDGLADVVVANAGSNDISVLRGAVDSTGRWTLTFGVRVNSGGLAPAGIAVGDFVTAAGGRGGDGIPDIVVTNRGSDTAHVISGRAGGFFNDRLPIPLELPQNAAPGPIFASGTTIAIGNVGAGSITLFDVTRAGAASQFFASRTYSSGGSGPSSLAAFYASGSTYLAVGNTSGTVALFLGRPGSIDFTSDRSFQLANVTGIAFDSIGRLFAMTPSRQAALQLFAFETSAAESSSAAGLQALQAGVVFMPFRASQVALVAMIVSVGGVWEANAGPRGEEAEEEPRDEAGDDVELTSAAAGETTDAGAENEAEAAAEEGKTNDEAAIPGLKLFLDVEDALQENNARLIDALLDDVPAAEAAGEPAGEPAPRDAAAVEPPAAASPAGAGLGESAPDATAGADEASAAKATAGTDPAGHEVAGARAAVAVVFAGWQGVSRTGGRRPADSVWGRWWQLEARAPRRRRREGGSRWRSR